MRRVCCMLAALAAVSAPALAWKPYTHNTSAYEAYEDAVDDGYVTINGREYKVADAVMTALRDYRPFYNAGVIGPDGFPDLTYGQSVIHPSETGAWLRHLWTQTWGFQDVPPPPPPLPDYLAAEKQRVLAFTYGFLTHAAGDMWGHTFVNDFARGVFPGVSEILSSSDQAAIAVRHIAVEGYIGDATPGFDGNRNDRNAIPGGDVSDDSTPGISYDVPHAFINTTLVLPDAGTPSGGRGPLIDFFLELRGGLQAMLPPPDEDSLAASVSLEEAVGSVEDMVAALEDMEDACGGGQPADRVHCLAPLDMEYAAVEVTQGAATIWAPYLREWIEDIDVGLQNWSQLGLEATRGLFDAQTRRALQNAACFLDGSEDTPVRAECEKHVSTLDVVLEKLSPFVSLEFERQPALLSMLGAPDQLLGPLSAILEEFLSLIDPLMQELLGVVNPLRLATEELKLWAKNYLKEEIGKVLGIDIDALQDLLTNPSRWVCVEGSTEFRLPGLGTKTIDLFRPGDHHRLDHLLGIPDAHHVPEAGFPPECGRLDDHAQLQFANAAALRNTVTTAKLLLLDGPELNRLLSDIVGRPITQYQPRQNIMVHALDSSQTWLRSIDSDHAWRRDGLPRFCDDGGPCPVSGPQAPEPRSANLNGGHGNFPLWESCVLRPAFRALFVDWEGNGFPDLGDDPSADPVQDPQAPVSRLGLVSEKTYSSGGRTWLAASHHFTQSAQDAPAGRAFSDAQLSLRRRVYRTGTVPGAFQTVSQNSTFALQTPDGPYSIEIQSADDCHRFEGPLAPAETSQTYTFTLDTTPPAIVCDKPPFNQEWDTDDTPKVAFGVNDNADGSGVASQSATVDGFQSLPGVVPTSAGATLDLFYFQPGTRRVAISAADNLGHASANTCTFELHASPQSLASNVARAYSQGLILGQGIANSLQQKMGSAQQSHDRGQHAAEASVLRAFIQELQAQRGKKVDAAIADRFITFALDRISTGR